MGIRFACHVCAKQLHIKEELAGKRGICPACSSKFRIPQQSAERSLAIEVAPKKVAPKKTESQPVGVAPAAVSPATIAQSAAAPVPSDSSAAKPDVEIDLLSSDPDATWYVRPPSGGQYGPADGDVLRAWISEGRVAATALLWRDGWPNWRSANEVLPGLASTSPSQAPGSATASASASAPAPAPAPPQSHDQPASGSAIAKPGLGQAPGSEKRSATPALTGRSDVGTSRRQKSGKRIFWIGTLSAIAIALIAVLGYLISQNG